MQPSFEELFIKIGYQAFVIDRLEAQNQQLKQRVAELEELLPQGSPSEQKTP